MQVQTCPHCENPISVEMGTGFLCCMECKRRLLGFSWWPQGGRPASLPLFKTAADADAAASRTGESYELSAIWTDVSE
jgi:hypothetical protein